MLEQGIKLKLQEQIGTIAKSLAKGKDVEIRKIKNGVAVMEVSKKVVAR